MNPNVIIHVEGGIARVVNKPLGIVVEVHDFDSDSIEEPERVEIYESIDEVILEEDEEIEFESEVAKQFYEATEASRKLTGEIIDEITGFISETVKNASINDRLMTFKAVRDVLIRGMRVHFMSKPKTDTEKIIVFIKQEIDKLSNPIECMAIAMGVSIWMFDEDNSLTKL